MPDLTPCRPASDRNLLFGILALQMDFIGRDALIAAMNAWILDKAKSLLNEAGVTNRLVVGGTERSWLEARIVAGKPLRPTLSGATVEYMLLSLKAAEAGKREATLKFDVGQGTQDLGFRAEVPILFTVKP